MLTKLKNYFSKEDNTESSDKPDSAVTNEEKIMTKEQEDTKPVMLMTIRKNLNPPLKIPGTQKANPHILLKK